MWHSFSKTESTVVCCANCRRDIELGPMLDHHPGICCHCGVECCFLDWKNRKVQIVVQNAPSVFLRVLHWTQDNLDELEYVELRIALEELLEAAENAE